MKQKDFTYAVSRIRCRETRLLSDSDIDQLMRQSDVASCLRLLKDKGWGNSSSDESPQELLKIENDDLWSFVREIIGDSNELDFLLVPDDFHNLKVAIKSLTRDIKPDSMFIYSGLTDPMKIYDAVEKREYDRLPEYLCDVANEAMTAILQTSDGQLCDVIVDNACLRYISSLKGSYSDETARMYCEFYVASADIRVAVRCARALKKHDFIARALAPCESLNVDKLAFAASSGFDRISEYLLETDYKSSVPALEKSLSAFEKWSDDHLIGLLKPQKREPFAFGAVLAYIIARQNELKAVRMILSAKTNGLDDDVIRERLRIMYV